MIIRLLAIKTGKEEKKKQPKNHIGKFVYKKGNKRTIYQIERIFANYASDKRLTSSIHQNLKHFNNNSNNNNNNNFKMRAGQIKGTCHTSSVT